MIKNNLKKGDKLVTGHIVTSWDAITYNIENEKCNRWMKERGYIPESLLNSRNHTFKMIINSNL